MPARRRGCYVLRRILATTLLAAIIFGCVYSTSACMKKRWKILSGKVPKQLRRAPKEKSKATALLKTYAITLSSFKRLQRRLMKSSQDLDREYWCRGTFLSENHSRSKYACHYPSTRMPKILARWPNSTQIADLSRERSRDPCQAGLESGHVPKFCI